MRGRTIMQRTTRDCIAAALAAILMCPLILGSVGGRAPELAGGPPDAGTLVEEETAPNRHAPAGDGSPPKQSHDDFKTVQAKPAEKSFAPAAEPNVPPREHGTQPRSEAQVSKPSQTVAQSTPSPPKHRRELSEILNSRLDRPRRMP